MIELQTMQEYLKLSDTVWQMDRVVVAAIEGDAVCDVPVYRLEGLAPASFLVN